YPSNKLGLCDMHGNVSQWTRDGGGPPTIPTIGKPDGVGPRINPAIGNPNPYDMLLNNWAVTGGNWQYGGIACSASHRDFWTPILRNSGLGFRLVRVPTR